ncbi:hypothetical protein SEA_KUDEFRE_124 [Gordonia phage Kudefre]|uniref:Uncharacterized protein n=1 Tax=Gordonia phage Kudefre TaxID=2885975 RepID=A0AAE8Y692_9CAUD|nr:hypothetical protein L3Y24_gp119 [Gordonia phage Kudefre]UDL15342.1 hypothetical protein SEA_KUDEFRE_124 [Gordonia phage Kudefre]
MTTTENVPATTTELAELKAGLEDGHEVWSAGDEIELESGNVYKCVSHKQVDSRRWVSVHYVIMESPTGRFYRYVEEQPLTEYQEASGIDVSTLREVFAKEKTIRVWVER